MYFVIMYSFWYIIFDKLWSTDGFKCSTIITGFDVRSIQHNTSATAIKYKTNSLTVDRNGVSVGGLALSYFIIMH